MIAAAFNLTAVGTVIALTVAVAFAVGCSAAPRVRYAIAVVAFFAAAVLPLVSKAPAPVQNTVTQAAQPPRSLAYARDDIGRVLWLSVAALLLMRELLGHAVLHFRRRGWDRASRDVRNTLQWPADVELFVSDEPPATIGLFDPVVVLPENWLDPRVARHELAHARWRDPLVNALVRVVRAILWPSVPLWYLERVIRTEREVAADAFAVGGDKAAAIDYATMLVSAADRRLPRAATALGNGIGLEERINRLFDAARPNNFRVACAAMLLVLGGACTFAVPIAPTDAKPSPHAIPGRATAEYEVAARAMNDILDRTRFHNHDATPTVHQLLGRMRSAGTVAPVLDALDAEDLRTREAVAWIAGELRDPALVPALAVRLRDPDPRVRETSAWALGMIGDRRAVAPLRAAVRSHEWSTRHAAEWALSHIRKD